MRDNYDIEVEQLRKENQELKKENRELKVKLSQAISDLNYYKNCFYSKI